MLEELLYLGGTSLLLERECVSSHAIISKIGSFSAIVCRYERYHHHHHLDLFIIKICLFCPSTSELLHQDLSNLSRGGLP
jgi:hypothetical protein